jgi:hypothetical protein
MKHIIMMAICCGLPVLILLILSFLGVLGDKFRLDITSIVLFLCPLMMIFMIPIMLMSAKEGKSCCEKKKDETNPHE